MLEIKIRNVETVLERAGKITARNFLQDDRSFYLRVTDLLCYLQGGGNFLPCLVVAPEQG